MFSLAELLIVLVFGGMLFTGVGVVIYLIVRRAARDGARDAAKPTEFREPPST